VNSAIYTGEVLHRRYVGGGNTFRYQVFYLLLDLDELGQLGQLSRLFGVNRPAWFSYRDADHGAGNGEPFKQWLAGVARDAGYAAEDWSFRVLTMPRMFGYVFNPITVVFCHRRDGSVAAMIYEVNNTFGERIAYLAPVDSDQTPIRQRCDKEMFVSPFFELRGHYDFFVNWSEMGLRVGIDYSVDDSHHMHASFNGSRQPFGARTLQRLAITHPVTTLKVTGGIHYEALKLWLRGIPLVRHASALKKTSIGTEL
jgi:DUF1365 family protein